jgi:phosphoenolpyruvate phosphomutase
MTRKTTQLRNLLRSPQLEFLMEAHNGLSARIVQEAGFQGIWGSGLSISAALGVRDSNEASWTQVLEMTEFMNDAVNIPIMLDADTGYGNFNNVRRLVRKLEQRGIAGMCIEDKLFPKTNSFINGEQQSLAEIDEFAGKIKAAKDTQQDPDFCVVARLESLIVGHGLTETLERARAYHQAGADALLIHSKRSTPEQILAFMHQWKETCPVVIVPTSYFKTPAEVFDTAMVSVVMWANLLMRASLAAMQGAAAEIYRSRSLAQVEEEIAPLREVFRLQDVAELEAAEDRYLPKRTAAGTSPPEHSLLQAA